MEFEVKDKAAYNTYLGCLPLSILFTIVSGIAMFQEGYALIGILLFAGGIFLGYLIKVMKVKPPLPIPEPPTKLEHGTAIWSPLLEFRTVNQPEITNDKGLWIGGNFKRTVPGHLITVAQPGAGKGTNLIIPTLLVEPCGSYVVTDPKGENACITAHYQQSVGQKVYIIDPWDVQNDIGAKHGIPISGFNPLDMVRQDWKKIPDRCEMIATILSPDTPVAKEPFWDRRGRSLIKLLLLHILTWLPEEEQNFLTLYRYLRQDAESLAGLIMSMKDNNHFDGIIQMAANEIYGIARMAPETFGGYLSHAQEATKIFESPELRKSLSKSDFNPYDLPNGDCTVYLVIPDDYIRSHSAWLKMTVELCIKAVNSRPNKRVNFIVDEAGFLGKITGINDSGYTFGRGQGIVMWTFFQSISMIKDVYGEAAMNDLIAKSNVFQAFGLRDPFSQEQVSKLLGTTTKAKWTTSTSQNDTGTSISEGWTTFEAPLMSPEEVGRCPDIITFADGEKYPIPKLPYFQDPVLSSRAQPAPRVYH